MTDNLRLQYDDWKESIWREYQVFRVKGATGKVQAVPQVEVQTRRGDRKNPVQIKADVTERSRARQESAPEEAERIDRGLQSLQWRKIPKDAKQIKLYGVFSIAPTKQTNQTGWWTTPL